MWKNLTEVKQFKIKIMSTLTFLNFGAQMTLKLAHLSGAKIQKYFFPWRHQFTRQQKKCNFYLFFWSTTKGVKNEHYDVWLCAERTQRGHVTCLQQGDPCCDCYVNISLVWVNSIPVLSVVTLKRQGLSAKFARLLSVQKEADEPIKCQAAKLCKRLKAFKSDINTSTPQGFDPGNIYVPAIGTMKKQRNN